MDHTGRALLWAILATTLIMAPLLGLAALAPPNPTIQMTVDEFNRRW
jgi:hypothetical protein